MKRKVMLFMSAWLIAASYVGATTVFLEAGKFDSVFSPPAASATFFAGVLEGEGRVAPAFAFGRFTRGNEAVDFMSVSLALRTKREGWYSELRLGAAGIDRETERLGTQWQFHLGAFGGWRGREYVFRIGLQHFSNGSKIFGSPLPNKPEEYWTIGIGRRFTFGNSRK